MNENIASYLRRCRAYSGRSEQKLRLLDVGCGAGILLSRAAEEGFICERVEICDPLAKITEEKVHCKVHRTFLRDAELTDSNFDVITMYDLIEHLPDPFAEIHRAHQLLRPGGILFILTPNGDALIKRVATWGYRLSLHMLNKPMRVMYYSDHLSYFNFHSLNTLLGSTGFQVVHSETRNQELSRLRLSKLERHCVRAVFRVSQYWPSVRGKLLVWARKPTASEPARTLAD